MLQVVEHGSGAIIRRHKILELNIWSCLVFDVCVFDV